MTTTARISPDQTSRVSRLSAGWWEPALVGLVAFGVLCSVIAYYDNVNRATTNGLWKSIDVQLWVEGAPTRFTDGANMLYYPTLGAIVGAMPEQVFGTIWQRMAYLNAAIAAGVLVLTYLIGLRLFGSRGAALFACLSQLTMGFFLLLGTITEDIMPGYFWFVAAIACAVLPRTFTPAASVLAAQCVALSWLFHSSLQFPGIGAFVVGIILWAGGLRAALWRVALFCLALVPLPLVSADAFDLPWTVAFWSGKGIGSGWGGFSISKVVFLWSGVAQSVVGGENAVVLADILAYPRALTTALVSLVIGGLFVVWLWVARRRWVSPEWRLAAGVLTAVFLLGEGMNLYIQPQDPQMQIQPMTWFPFAAAAVFWLSGRIPRWRDVVRVSLVVVTTGLGVFNLLVYAGVRHADSIALANTRIMASLAPPERTVFLFHGFESIATWLTVAWGRGVINPVLGTPEARRFNSINVIDQATITPDRSPDEAARDVLRVVGIALDTGADVIANDLWSYSADQWVDSFSTISGPGKPRAIHAALHEHFTGTPIGDVPGWTRLYRLTRRTAGREDP